MQDYAVAHEEVSRLGTKLQPSTAAAQAAAQAAEATLWDALTTTQVLQHMHISYACVWGGEGMLGGSVAGGNAWVVGEERSGVQGGRGRVW